MHSLQRLVHLLFLYASMSAPTNLAHAQDYYLDTQLSQYVRNEPAAVSALLHTYTFGLKDLSELNPFLDTADLANIPSGAACGAATSDTICRDRPGLGSGLDFSRESHVFFAQTDRGPNQDCENYYPATKRSGVNFPVPKFSPSFVSFRLENGAVRLLSENHLRKTSGDPVSGRSNTLYDDRNFVDKCTSELGDSPDGIDWEDVRRFPDGVHFIGSEEYSPSVFVFDATGTILKRYVPFGQKLVTTETTGYPVADLLPPVVANRRSNRGFENLALTKDGKRAYAVLQSPMGNATLPEFAKSRMIRVVELDVTQPANATYVGMYAFLMSDPSNYKGNQTTHVDVKLGSTAHLEKKKLLVLEQGVGGKKLYTVDLSRATNLKGRFDDSLKPENATTDLRHMGIRLGKMKIVFDTDEMPVVDVDFVSAKQEGLAVLAPSTAVIASDNDFGLKNGNPTQVRFLHLTSKLPGIRKVRAASEEGKKPQCDFRHCVADKCYIVLGKAPHSTARAACKMTGAVLASLMLGNSPQTSSSRLKEVLRKTLGWDWMSDKAGKGHMEYAWFESSSQAYQGQDGQLCAVAVNQSGDKEVKTDLKPCDQEYPSLCEVARPSEC